MRDASALPVMTVEEYFRFAETSPEKYEYVAGEVYAMSGVTRRHDRIATNVLVRLSLAARPGPCDVLSGEVRVQVASDRYYHPDTTVSCTPFADSDIFVRDPCVVVEVTSPSTARIDRGEKLDAYRSITSLRAYLIIDHRRRRVERHARDSQSGEWQREEIVGEGRVRIPCIDVEITLDEIYERVELPSVNEPDPLAYQFDGFAYDDE